MKTDQAIEEIRETRKQISRKYNDNITALLNHYRTLEDKYATRMISRTSPRIMLQTDDTQTIELAETNAHRPTGIDI